MVQNFDGYRERTTTASVDSNRVQAGWTVYDALDRPVGNVTELEAGELRIDGRPEGLGFYTVPADTIREVGDGSVHLTIDSDVWRGEGQTSGGLHAADRPDAEAAFEDTAPIGQAPRMATAAGSEDSERWSAPTTARREEVHGSSYTASNTPVGLGSNTPVGDEPDAFRTWDQDIEGSPWSKLRLAAAPVALGAASAAAYFWWRNRQTRRGRLARLTRGLTAASGSVAPVLEAARERRGSWWLASLAALPLAYFLRSAVDKDLVEEMVPDVSRSTGWRDHLPSMPALRSMPAMPSMPDAIQPPPLWTAAVPVVAAGLAAAWFATKRRGRSYPAERPKRLREIMTRNVEVIGPETTIFEAAATMRRLGVGFLPVCDGRRLQGVLTDRDIVVRPVADSRDPQVTTVQHAMSSEVIYAFDDDTVERGAELMKQHQIRRLPIVDRGKNLVGVVSLGDLAVDTDQERMAGRTLERISEPARPRR